MLFYRKVRSRRKREVNSQSIGDCGHIGVTSNDDDNGLAHSLSPVAQLPILGAANPSSGTLDTYDTGDLCGEFCTEICKNVINNKL